MKKVRSKLRPTEIGVIKTFSLSPDDEVGEIAVQCSGCTYYYNNLSELCEKWEDYEEPKKYWYITGEGDICRDDIKHSEWIEDRKSIGNYFGTEEEAEKAVEKLKAWKRLRDKGFRFILDEETEMPMFIYSGANGEKCITNAEESKQCRSDIKLLFGGKK